MPVHESELNVRVASILSSVFGLDCRAERAQRRARPDIRCYYSGLRIVIEASYSASDAERDARERVEKGLADIALALRYTREYPDVPELELRKMLKESTFDVMIVVPRELKNLEKYIQDKTRVAKPVEGWFRGVRLENIADFVKHAVAYIVEEAEVKQEVKKVKQVIEDFTNLANSVDESGTLRERIANILYRLYGFSIAEMRDAEVIFGQAALAILLSTVFYERLRHVHGLPSVESYIKSKGVIHGLRSALEDMLKIDYEPALKLAIEILNEIPSTLSTGVKNLIDCALRISEMGYLLARDFAGRVYHEIVGDIAVRKGFATFYTEIPAAYMLTNLALRVALGVDDLTRLSSSEAEKILNRVADLKIADFACGSGTLLTASLYNASRIAKTLCFLHDVGCQDIEKKLVEEGIYGLDALRYATQITAINLALMTPANIIKENISTIYLGYIEHGVYRGAWLGSLELLDNGKKVGGLLQYIEKGLGGVVEKISVTGTESGKIELPDFYDVVVMNPPFTRATGRVSEEFEEGREGLFGFIVDENARKNILDRYRRLRDRVREEMALIASQLFKVERQHLQHLEMLGSKASVYAHNLTQYYSIGQAGEGLLFLYLAYRYVKPGGVIAFVLPRNLLSGVSWFLARALLAGKFHLRYVIVSSDSGNGYNFSEGTSLSECLVVAKRVDDHSPNEETVFVNLLTKPRSALEALLLAEEVSRLTHSERQEMLVELFAGSNARALVTKVGRARLLKNIDNMGRFVAFPEPEILKLALKLTEEGKLGIKVGDKELEVPITRLHNITETIGIDAHQFHDLYRVVSTTTPYPVVHGGGESIRSAIHVRPNAYAHPVNDKGRVVFERFSSRLLVPDRIWVDTAHVIALYSEVPTLSNIFYAIRLKASPDTAEKVMKVFAYWLNTTWGILTILSSREETRGRWIRLKMAQWKLLPVLDVNKLNNEVLERIVNIFDSVSRKSLRRLPQQYSENPDNVDPVRLEIDLGFLKALDPDIDEDKAKAQLLEIYKRIAIAFRQWIN